MRTTGALVATAILAAALVGGVEAGEPGSAWASAHITETSTNGAGRLVWLFENAPEWHPTDVQWVDLTNLKSWSASETARKRPDDAIAPDQVAEGLASSSEWIDALAAAARIEAFDGGEPNTSSIDGLWPRTDPRSSIPTYSRSACRVFVGDAVRLWTHDDRDGAVDRIDAAFALAAHLAGEDQPLLFGLTSHAITAWALDVVERMAREDLTDGQRAALIAAVERLDAADPAGVTGQWAGEFERAASWLDARVDAGPADAELLRALSGVQRFGSGAESAFSTTERAARWFESLGEGGFRRAFDSLRIVGRDLAGNWDDERARQHATTAARDDVTYLSDLLLLQVVDGLVRSRDRLRVGRDQVLVKLRG